MIIIPHPMPDELGQGYVCRVAYLLGFDSVKDLRRVMLGKVPREGIYERYIPTGLYLSGLVGMKPAEYIASHTLIHYRYAFPRAHFRQSTFLDKARRLAGEYDGPLQNQLAYCAVCIVHDIESFGFSWWRRTHQLPSYELCHLHETPLHIVRGKACVGALSLDVLKKPIAFKTTIYTTNGPMIERFRLFSVWLLNLAEPLDLRLLHSVILNSLNEIGISRCFHRKNLTNSPSLLVKKKFPSKWLSIHYPKLVSTQYKGRDRLLDCHYISQGVSATVLSILLATLYQSPAELNENFLRHIEGLKEPAGKERARLFRLYVDHMGDARKIAEALNILEGRVHSIFRRAGFIPLARVATHNKSKILDWLRTATLEDIDDWNRKIQDRISHDRVSGLSHYQKIKLLLELIEVSSGSDFPYIKLQR
ncbi:TniQ family protein [Chitinimonas naiadis]